MSLALFNAVPVGAIEVLFDVRNQTYFKRADLGRYLGIKDIRHMFKDVSTKSRYEIDGEGRGSEPLPQAGQNDHDCFVSLDSALEITASNQPTVLRQVGLDLRTSKIVRIFSYLFMV